MTYGVGDHVWVVVLHLPRMTEVGEVVETYYDHDEEVRWYIVRRSYRRLIVQVTAPNVIARASLLEVIAAAAE